MEYSKNDDTRLYFLFFTEFHRPEGIEALYSDLEDEWRRGLKALRVDNVKKLKKSLPELKKEALKSVDFEDFYLFAFRYCLTEKKQKCLDIESTCILIDLVLGFQYPAQVDSFIQFLKIQSDYKVMNMDQWKNFLRFCEEISFPDLQNYDTCEAWPLLLDNFVD
ncbi:defective in cullin neddylation protein [Striga asiatica]|uniref:Defective in cullin neddylation protein n=1 Tax=Striga asiatica TaxID=4170 RepID=A0A5A7QKS1_STRAF|nr:defective in cullin neddylation protein [Striga asiatica]